MQNKKIEIDRLDLSNTIITILDLLDDCILITDKEGKMIFYNHASEKLDNLSRDFVIGRHITECFKLDEETSITLRCLRNEQPVINIYQSYLTVSGNQITSVSSSYPLFSKNNLVGALTITKDISKFQKLLNILYNNHGNNPINSSNVTGSGKNYTFEKIVGQSKILKNSINIAQKSAQTISPILLYGETGTGKEVFAQSIHNASNVKGPFVSLNCAAVPENLLEGILFGTAKGAFTGASDRPGLFEEASNGTLFLDELNSMTLNLQSKLLRAIETSKIRRVGETKERDIKPRIISALNVPPVEAVKQNLLRLDLFYRLGVISIKLPSLAERKEDIPVLVEHFINRYNKDFDRSVNNVSPDVMELFLNYSWPGNVRELEHAIEYAMNLIELENIITKEYLPPIMLEQMQDSFAQGSFVKAEIQAHYNIHSLIQENKGKGLKSLLEILEQEIILQILEASGQNVSAAAKELGMNRQSLDYKVKKYGLL